jgi:hypothetical protein
VTPLPLPHHDRGKALDHNTVYVVFVTNEGGRCMGSGAAIETPIIVFH